jgi:hypothetical protein
LGRFRGSGEILGLGIVPKNIGRANFTVFELFELPVG